MKDGGTIQLGIGTFADAVSHALVLRQKRNGRVRGPRQGLGRAGCIRSLPLETAPFAKGLYARDRAIRRLLSGAASRRNLKRRAFEDIETQRRADAGELSAGEYAQGAVMHAGFFFGSNALYEAMRNLPSPGPARHPHDRHLLSQRALRGRRAEAGAALHARFINSAMMVTLLGAIVCDQLEDGRAVSGIGGQYNFVAQAHELDDAPLDHRVPATRIAKGRVHSNIRWSYGHVPIPRHLRDMTVTEYGAADLRGLSDRDIIAAMLNIADSRFQEDLLRQAKAARKIEEGYEIPCEVPRQHAGADRELLAEARAAAACRCFPSVRR